MLYGPNNFEALMAKYKDSIKLAEAMKPHGLVSSLDKPQLMFDIA